MADLREQTDMEQGTTAKLCECGCGQPAPIASQTNNRLGYVKGGPMRFVQGHSGRGKSYGPKPRLHVEVGQRIGRGVVIDPDVRIPRSTRNSSERAARLLCECGNKYVRTLNNLLYGRGKGCGCGVRKPRQWDAPNRAARNIVLKEYRSGARNRGYAWELTGEDFDRLTSRECYYCGQPPSAVKKTVGVYDNGDFIYNGLDRVDNTLGYTPENVVPCCTICNRAKMDLPYSDFIAWIARLAAHQWFRPDQTPLRLLKGGA